MIKTFLTTVIIGIITIKPVILFALKTVSIDLENQIPQNIKNIKPKGQLIANSLKQAFENVSQERLKNNIHTSAILIDPLGNAYFESTDPDQTAASLKNRQDLLKYEVLPNTNGKESLGYVVFVNTSQNEQTEETPYSSVKGYE
jgi:hypothetical protein